MVTYKVPDNPPNLGEVATYTDDFRATPKNGHRPCEFDQPVDRHQANSSAPAGVNFT
jgi:hypothetical protein